ncbi:DUF3422 domain-containing protein [Meridianimarinicoccus roseus]|jgi:uncharacterized membrane-anchored protein|uniref:DUF3422 domain-containing protein n=1 Tax=Meridianimarinicoccus roseus TaxID=2072018 RepID=A0A2V2L681_9RHOB|nr:DUF3422 domain-containing protein [Meridianimarinicoccus roseus]PWR00810.1 DUF3422 domain-containing protein [Meridianimarinicoccus roseus]
MIDHDLRYSLANELHARPFPSLAAPCRAIHLAIKQPTDAASRDRATDRAHLIDLLDRHGAQHPRPGATHYFGQIGKHHLKWESHTEFVTYTLFSDGVAAQPFDGRSFELFPKDWLENAPGVRVTSALIRIERLPDFSTVAQKIEDWFVPESVAVSQVIDGSAVIAGDFRIDSNGHMRMAVFAAPQTGNNRIGRIVQRLTEIETYKTVSMLGLAMARELNSAMNGIETDMSEMVGNMSGETAKPEATLKSLLSMAAELENLSTKSTFRFGATGAYEALVNQRIEALRETRFEGRQTFAEFMMRRYDPAMRTVKAAERRLASMTDRAIRAGGLLRTRVDVERSAQNQLLLESMDKRADMQLRLQKTVEGLSVVAISYYAVSLVLYVAAPLSGLLDLSKTMLGALVAPPVVIAVWYMVGRIRKAME